MKYEFHASMYSSKQMLEEDSKTFDVEEAVNEDIDSGYRVVDAAPNEQVVEGPPGGGKVD